VPGGGGAQLRQAVARGLAGAERAEASSGRPQARRWMRLGLTQEWRWRLLFRDGNPIFRPAPTRAGTGRRRSPVWGTATNGARPTKADGLKGRTRARSPVRCTRGGKSEGETTQRHEVVAVRATRRGFDAQRMTGGGGKPVLMASPQMERAVEFQDPEIRQELNRHVRECERKCFASGRLNSIPQASARARQQATREQVKSQ
jgi:hypothetical protein